MFKYYFVATLALLFGTFRIYKHTFSFDKMTKIHGKVLSKSLNITVSRGRGTHTTYYSLAITTDAVNYQIGIPLGEDYVSTGYYSSISDLFNTNTSYTFYLNSLVAVDQNKVWCGVDKVEDNGKVVYQNNRNNDLIYGSLIIVVTLIIIIYIAKKYDLVKITIFGLTVETRV